MLIVYQQQAEQASKIVATWDHYNGAGKTDVGFTVNQ